MRNAEGYSVITPAGGRVIEHDTTTCGHCNAVEFTKGAGAQMKVIVFKTDGSHELRDARICHTCWRWVCPKRQCDECVPFEKRLDIEEKKLRGLI